MALTFGNHPATKATKCQRRNTCALAALTLAAGFVGWILLAAAPAFAHDYAAGTIKIDHPWTRATPPGAKVAGGYVKLTNFGKETDRLFGGSFALSKRVEVHEMSMSDGVMRMAELKDGLELPPGATVEMKPGGYHLMLMELSSGPKAGEKVKGTLRFEKAGEIEVEFAVAPLGAKSPDGNGSDMPAGDGHSGHDMKHNH